MGCGFAGAALVEENAAVVGGIEITSAKQRLGYARGDFAGAGPHLSLSSIPPPGPPCKYTTGMPLGLPHSS